MRKIWNLKGLGDCVFLLSEIKTQQKGHMECIKQCVCDGIKCTHCYILMVNPPSIKLYIARVEILPGAARTKQGRSYGKVTFYQL